MCFSMGSTALANETSPTVISAEENTISDHNELNGIYATIEQYHSSVFKKLSLEDADVSFLDALYAPEGSKALNYEKAFLKVKIQHHKQQEADLRLLMYSFESKYNQVDIVADKAYVEMSLSGSRTYAYDNIPQYFTDEKHVFQLIRTIDGWNIVEHTWNETLEQDFRQLFEENGGNIEKTITNVMTEVAKDTQARKFNSPVSVNETTDMETPDSDIVIQAYSNNYNRTAFVNYALDWHDGSNPNYIVRGADCANFGSQCLKAGGAPDDKAGGTDLQWYYDGTQRYSWYAAQGLRYYLLNNGGSSSNIGVKAAKVSTISSVYEGDFAFNINPTDNRATHTIVIVGNYYSSNGVKTDLYITQHSNSPSYGLLSQVSLTGRTRELIHISGVYK